jgi:hypothetical protein
MTRTFSGGSTPSGFSDYMMTMQVTRDSSTMITCTLTCSVGNIQGTATLSSADWWVEDGYGDSVRGYGTHGAFFLYFFTNEGVSSESNYVTTHKGTVTVAADSGTVNFDF